jgi:uncharacterized protein (TIGR02444 family)
MVAVSASMVGSMANPFWEYSLARYEADGVAPACLLLQDDFGLDINLLLYAGWLAHEGQQLSESHLCELDALIADWRERVVRPLRGLRRQLRDYPAAAALRQQVKSLELQAERQQQDRMYGYYQRAPALPREQGALSSNLALVVRHGRPQDSGWQGSIHRLAALLAP